MTDKRKYRVTDRAGAWVAGQRRPASGVLELTPRQAAYELALGTIEPMPEPKPKRASRRKRAVG